MSLSGRLPVLTDKQTMLFSQFGENKSTGLSLCCLATVLMNTKQIKDGCKLADEGLCLLHVIIMWFSRPPEHTCKIK